VPDTSPALPPSTLAPLTPASLTSAVPALPPAPVSPDVEVPGLPVGTADPGLARLMEAFRTLQLRHARVLAHESATHGLGVTDTRFLLHLAAADDQTTTPKRAGELLELSTGATTSLLDRLERHGHLERRPNPGDRRSILVHLTPSGAAVARAIVSAYADAFSEAVAPAERAGVAVAFEQIGAALDRRPRAAAAG